jgi:cyclohexanecarboxylate-CoA ligase
MAFDKHISPAQQAAARASGFWRDRTLLDYLDEAVAATPDKVAVTALAVDSGRVSTCSYRQLDRWSRRIGAGLIKMGIKRGDVVSMQLPNCLEFVLVHLACLRAGAITNPLMPFLRHRELGFMMGLAESKLAIIPRSFRGFNHAAMFEDLRAELPQLGDVLIVGESFEEKLLHHPWEDEVDAAQLNDAQAAPDDLIEILYTSGTTGEPKGVMHTSNSLLSGMPGYAKRLGLGPDSVVFMASPMAHQTGFLYGMMTALTQGAKLVVMDQWNVQAAARLIQDEGCSYTMSATPFLADLTEEMARRKWDFSRFRVFLAAGAPIPRALVRSASERLGATIAPGWGMTEMGLATSTEIGDSEELRANSDGKAFEYMELRVVDPEGRPLPPGTEGRLQSRGAGLFVGYLKRPALYAVDADGWFETGDLARMDGAGYIRITGRSKDIIIRGGENIPVVEIENVLYGHPSVREVAIVGIPDERLGERACAFVTLHPGQHFDFSTMTAHLAAHQVARQYHPERLEVIEAMPRTATGKIQKFRLREFT